MIGWKAKEDQFLKMLADGITHKLKVIAVSGKLDWAVSNLAGIDAEAIESSYWFTGFIVNREGDDFLRS